MRSRDIVMDSIEFRSPERLPFAQGPSADIATVGYAPACDFVPQKPGMNEWGAVWQSLNVDKGDQGQVVEHPLDDWSRFTDYRFPDPSAAGRMDHVPAQIRQYRQEGKFVVGGLGKGPMHLLDDLRGFENYLMDLAAAPERIDTLLDGIFLFLTGMVRRYAELKVDAVFMTDDQAMQTGPLFSMEMWRRHFKPRYRQLFSLAHEHGMKVFMHACGNLSELLVDLADAGVDILDNKQPALWMHSPAVDQVRGKISFSTCIDIQSTIHTIAEDQIEAEVEHLVRRLSVPEGGFIATCYSKPDMQLPAAKVERMLNAFKSFRWK